MGDVVVENFEEEAARLAREHHGNGQHAERPDRPHDGTATQDEAVTGLAAALGREVYTWTSPYNPEIVVRFRRPRAGTDEAIYRILGAEQSANQQLVRQYKALAAIIEIGGQKMAMPNTDAKFRVLRDRIGFVGPDDDDVFDEPVNTFTYAYELAMYPDQMSAIAEAQGVGLSPDDVKRIARNAGVERPKP